MRRVWITCVLLLASASLAFAANTHNVPSEALERQAWFGDALGSYAVSGCLHGVPGSGLTVSTAACQAYIKASGGDLVYVTQPTKPVGPLTDASTNWIAVHRDGGSSVAGWTRQPGTHYLWKASATHPGHPTNGLVIASVTTSGGNVTAVTDYRIPRSYVLQGRYTITDGLYGAVSGTDSTAALQAAISGARGKCVYVPTGTWIVSTGVTYSTTPTDAPGLCLEGDGPSQTVFDNRVANDSMLTIDGSVTSSQFQMGMTLRGFSIVATTAAAASHGLSIKGIWQGTIEQICIGDGLCTGGLAGAVGLTGDAIRLTATLGDADSLTNISMRNLQLQGNTGYGIRYIGTGIIVLGYTSLDTSLITRNTAGGIRWHATHGQILNTGITQNGNTTNGTGGIYVEYDGAGNRNLTITGCQFDANAGAGSPGQDGHIVVDSILGLTIVNNEFKFQSVSPPGSFGPSYGLILGDGTNATSGVLIASNVVSSSPSNPSSATTWVYIPATGTSDVSIWGTTYPAFSGANATRFDDAAYVALKHDGGRWINGRLETELTSTAGGGTVTPDLRTGSYQRYSITSGTTVAIGEPTGGVVQGAELIIDVFNGVAGVMEVTWHSVFKGVKTWKLTASGGRNTQRFFYDTAGGNWVAQGQEAGNGRVYSANVAAPGIGSISAGVIATFDATVPGVAAGCLPLAAPRTTLGTACAGSTQCFVWSAFIQTSNTVRVLVQNVDGGSARTPNDVTWDVGAYCP